MRCLEDCLCTHIEYSHNKTVLCFGSSPWWTLLVRSRQRLPTILCHLLLLLHHGSHSSCPISGSIPQFCSGSTILLLGSHSILPLQLYLTLPRTSKLWFLFLVFLKLIKQHGDDLRAWAGLSSTAATAGIVVTMNGMYCGENDGLAWRRRSRCLSPSVGGSILSCHVGTRTVLEWCPSHAGLFWEGGICCYGNFQWHWNKIMCKTFYGL